MSETLSHGDEQVLIQVFDPESAPEAPTVKIDPSLPSDPYISDQDVLQTLKNLELQAIRLVESYSAKPNLSSISKSTPESTLTSDDNEDKEEIYQEAQAILTNIITTRPKYASAYNNRAQMRRWRYGESFVSQSNQAKMRTVIDDTIGDLKTAIALSSPAPNPSSPISMQQSKLLIQSWTQLAVVFWNLAKRSGLDSQPDHAMNKGSISGSESEWHNWDGTRLEEEASRCFYMAGVYGSDVGKSLAVKMNPYARLCGGIVKEAMKREISI